MKQDDIDNVDEIFCLVGEFLNRLRPADYGFKEKKDHFELVVLDKAKGRIAKELDEHYFVRERR